MTNPYISRGPIRNPLMFVGRGRELDEIGAFLKGNQSIAVIGPRKIGKTSLLFHLMRPATLETLGLGSGYLLTYLDCEVLGESSHEDIFGQVAWELAAALTERSLPPEPVLDEVVSRPSRLTFERAIRRLNQRNLRVVLLLDEFERLSTNPNLDVNFFNALRSIAGRYQFAFITASARPLIQLTYSGRSQEILSSPFFNIFAPLFLGLFPESDARRLIQEPALANGRPFPPDMVNFIFDLAGGHPLGLQVACFYAFDELTNPPDAPKVAELMPLVEQRALQELVAHFQYYWHNLTASEQNALRQVSELAERVQSDTTLRAVLRDLVQKSLLVNDGGNYRLPSRAWAGFVSSQAAESLSPAQARRTLAGTRFGAYEVLELLGRGGMAEVYKGRHTRLERTVAIKILPPNLAAEADFRARFEREARAVAALRHPNIVQMFDFGDVEGAYYMVMEFIAGQDLSKMMAEIGPMPLDLVTSLMRDLAGALDYAHAQGLVHRDVKPSNVLLHRLDRPAASQALHPAYSAVLTDFGIAKMLGGDTGATQTGLMMGTLNYMAPEQIRSSGEVDCRADIYALGVMLYQMLTGRLPYQADNPGAMMLAHLQLSPTDPREFIPALPPRIVETILCALAKDPADRFATVGEMVNLL